MLALSIEGDTMKRITRVDLDNAIDALNAAAGTPAQPYTREVGRLVSQVGNYHVASAYGGFALHQMANEAGGIRDIFNGYYSKRELLHLIRAMLAGMAARVAA
jgi:hypothetical protein